jgi:hypothetical protein
MSASFWILLVLCFGTALEAAMDFKERVDAIKKAKGKKQRRKAQLRLLFVWLVFFMTLAGTIYTVYESIASETEKHEQSIAFNSATNELETLRLGSQPRKITASQKQTFIDLLKTVPKSKVNVAVEEDMGKEARDYGGQIADLISAAGFEVQITHASANGIPDGVSIKVKKSANPPVASIAIQKAFNSIGIDAPGQEDSRLPDDTIIVQVGAKPTKY